jgi:hypothetical protein
MAIFDCSAQAELSPTASEGRYSTLVAGGCGARSDMDDFADAIRFAIEELPPELLPAVQLKAAEERFDGDGIRRLYESVKYPLARRAVSRWRMRQGT